MASSWERLSNTTLGSTADIIDTGTFTAKTHLRVHAFILKSGAASTEVIFNNETDDANYASRRNYNGLDSEEDTYVGNANPLGIGFYPGLGDSSQASRFLDFTIINIATEEKVVFGHITDPGTAGAGNAPWRAEFAAKWANTSDQITRIAISQNSTGDYLAGSQLTVWGADDQVVTAKDKSSITNVPVGMRYEEVDTRKIFRRTSSTWVERGTAT